MFTVELCLDKNIIKGILTTKGLYDTIGDDGSVPPEQYEPDMNWFNLLLKKDNEIIGLAQAHSINSITLMCHINILPKFWGQRLDEAAHLAIKWIKTHTEAKKLVSLVPSECKPVLEAIKRYGFSVEGFLSKSIKRKGVVMGQHIMGLNLESVK